MITTAFRCTEATAITAPVAGEAYDLVLSARAQASASTRVAIGPRSALTETGLISITIPSGT